MVKVFYISQRLQIETEGPKDDTHAADAVFQLGAHRLHCRLEWDVQSTSQAQTKPHLSVVVKTAVYGCCDGAMDFQLLGKCMDDIRLLYPGISEVLGGAFLNGFFPVKF